MFEQTVEWLNNFKAGDVLLVIAILLWGGSFLYKMWKKSKDDTETEVAAKIRQQSEHTKILEDIIALNNELGELRKKTAEDLQTLRETLQALSTTGHDEVLHSVEELNEMVDAMEAQIHSLEGTIDGMKQQINLLFSSDKEYARGYLVEAYTKYVTHEHAIGLVTLQHIENMYNAYIAANEANANDEFIAKIIKELRDLPTTNDQ